MPDETRHTDRVLERMRGLPDRRLAEGEDA
jgi:hypothetical protein